jgi:hypothetical protein
MNKAALNINYSLLVEIAVVVISLEEALAVVHDGDLRHHRACPERGPMEGDAVAEDLGEDPPVLRPPV